MATNYKILGVCTIAANEGKVLYTVPASTSTVVSTFRVCNIGTATQTFRMATATTSSSTTPTDSYYEYYDVPIAANDTFYATAGITLGAGNAMIVRANSTSIVFGVYGSEIS